MIRKAPDPATAREQLMARDWPASDVVALGIAWGLPLPAYDLTKRWLAAHPDDEDTELLTVLVRSMASSWMTTMWSVWIGGDDVTAGE